MKIYSILICVLFLNSCVVQLVNGNAIGLLPKNQKEKIVKLENFKNLDQNKIFEISGMELKAELGNYQKSMVYLFTSSCTSENCVPLSRVESYARAHDYKLFLVLTNYYKLELTLAQKSESQLFAIDSEYYKIKKSRKYVNTFKKELGYTEFCHQNDVFGSVLIFEHDSLVKVLRSISE